jgi:hypothetical protein
MAGRIFPNQRAAFIWRRLRDETGELIFSLCILLGRAGQEVVPCMSGSIQQPEPVGVGRFPTRRGWLQCSCQEARPGETAEQFPPPPGEILVPDRILLPGVNNLMVWMNNHRSTVSQGRSKVRNLSAQELAKQLVKSSRILALPIAP